ncbi:MAG TPA: NAD-dependent epimerase/dehydratase family protein, partial [Myxococcota bacterium]|nr:NAD-dependent epimerase/dehydratase family protein [Myxococcota bacterium]
SVLDDLSVGRRENVPDDARLFEVDVRDGEAVRQVFAEVRPELVSHQAAQASVAVSVRRPAFDAEVNVVGSLHVVQACVEQEVARLVFASTGGAIYGEVAEGQLASESHPTHPLSPYACAKLSVEHYLAAFAAEHGLATTTLRYANVYGPRQDPHGEAGVVAIFARRLIRGEPIQVNARRTPGDDGCVRDYVHVRDVVAANLAAFEGRIDVPVLNVCTGVATDTRSLAERLRHHLGSASELRDGGHRAGDLERSVLDPGLLTHFVPRRVPLEEGLASTADWFRENG